MTDFVESYLVAARGLESLTAPTSDKDLVRRIHELGEKMYFTGEVRRREACVRANYANALAYFKERGLVIEKDKKLTLASVGDARRTGAEIADLSCHRARGNTRVARCGIAHPSMLARWRNLQRRSAGSPIASRGRRMSFRALFRSRNAAALCFAATAMAQQAPEDRTPPPPATDTATDEQPPAEALPPCPAPEQAQAQAAARRRRHRRPRPRLRPRSRITTVSSRRRRFRRRPASVPATTSAPRSTRTIDVGAAWDARLTFGTHSRHRARGRLRRLVEQHRHAERHAARPARLARRRQRLPPAASDGGASRTSSAASATTTWRSSQTELGVSLAGPLQNTDDQVTVPAGAGLSGYIGKHTTLDVRGTYRFIPDNGLTEMSPTRNLHQWVAQAHVGYVF